VSGITDQLAGAVTSESSNRHRKAQRPEQAVHLAVADHLRRRGVPGLVWTHPPNGGARSAIEGALFKAMGARAGTSDFLLWHAGQSFALELKAEGGKATPEQTRFLADAELAGVKTCVAEGLDAAVRQLEAWGLLRGRLS